MQSTGGDTMSYREIGQSVVYCVEVIAKSLSTPLYHFLFVFLDDEDIFYNLKMLSVFPMSL